MAYVKQKPPVLTHEQRKALVNITPAQIAELPPDRRLEMHMRLAEVISSRRNTFWSAVQGVAIGVIPILAFMGISSFSSRKRP